MSGTRYSPLAALAASPARPRAYDVMPEALIPAGTATVQNQSAAFPLDPISETPLLRQAGVTQGEEQRMLDNAVTAAGFSGGIRAFHGSPHLVDRFSSSRIGTGEGNQSYSYGLYFAGHEPVARGYRDRLSQGRYDTDAGVQDATAVYRRGLAALEGGGIHENRRGDVVAHVLDRLDQRGRARSGIFDGYDLPPGEAGEAYRRVAAALQDVRPTRGHMYEVDINADPARMLDWDAPVAQQPIEVRNAADTLRHLGRGGPDPFNPRLETGADVWRGLSSPVAGREFGYRNWSSSGPAEYLRSVDVPGTRYLDQLSRDAGQGTSNYVVFDDSLIDILRRYGILGTLAGGGAAAGASQDGTQ